MSDKRQLNDMGGKLISQIINKFVFLFGCFLLFTSQQVNVYHDVEYVLFQ